MSRAPALRKLLAVGPLYRDEIFDAMGGDRRQVVAAMAELVKAGDLPRIDPTHIRRRYQLTARAQANAFGGAHA